MTASPEQTAPTIDRPSPPLVFAATIIPFAAAVGYVSISAPFWLAHAGVSLEVIGGISATSMAPHAIKFLWAPVLDVGSYRKLWFIGTTILTALCLAALSFVPAPAEHLALYTLLATLAQIAATTSSAAADGLMAVTTSPDKRGWAGGARMAGNVGGTGVLGSLAIWVASAAGSEEKANMPVAGLVMAAITLASLGAMFFIHEPHALEALIDKTQSAGQVLKQRLLAIGRDLWATLKERDGWTGVVICLMPVGAGALTNLFSAMAFDYRTGISEKELEHIVEFVTGTWGGVVAAVGAVIGGWLAEKMNTRVAYAISGGITALSGLAMMLAPMTPLTFTWGTLAYNFANGIAFATLAAFILEMVGPGAAASTKYTLFIAFANVASSYVTFLDGWFSSLTRAQLPGGIISPARFAAFFGPKLGSRGALLGDAVLTFLGILVLIAMVYLARSGRPKAAAVPATPAAVGS